MPVTEEQKTIIKATVPILETGGEVLTKHFYGVMLSEFPEVVPFFNKTHQRSGDQPRALAHAVLMYAKNIDRLENIGGLAAQIINKHVALAVRADHYPIVGQCLLRSIREVLGAEVATDAVIDAWAAAYQQLADILIAAEEAVYKKNEEAVGGWRNNRSFEITRVEKESAEVTSFYLSPVDKKPVLAYLPGQYIGVMVHLNGQDLRRNYSLSQMSNGSEYRITVKKEPNGEVSTYLHSLHVGDKVDLLPPAGEFVLADNEDTQSELVFIGGGVGVTPLIAMLQHVLEHNKTRKITFVHSAKNKDVQCFGSYLNSLAETHADRLTVRHHYSNESGRFTAESLRALLPSAEEVLLHADVYMVGPKTFMSHVKQDLLSYGLPAAQLRYEFFGPAQSI